MNILLIYREQFATWFLSLGATYGVNPWIFGGIYVGAIPLFTLALGWVIRNYRQGQSVILPAFLAACCFVSAYVYLIIAGENVPAWVYVFIVGLLLFGVWSTWQKVQAGIKEPT